MQFQGWDSLKKISQYAKTIVINNYNIMNHIRYYKMSQNYNKWKSHDKDSWKMNKIMTYQQNIYHGEICTLYIVENYIYICIG